MTFHFCCMAKLSIFVFFIGNISYIVRLVASAPWALPSLLQQDAYDQKDDEQQDVHYVVLFPDFAKHPSIYRVFRFFLKRRFHDSE